MEQPKHTVNQVTDIAFVYIKKFGHSFARVKGAKFRETDKVWEVHIDVGVLGEEIKIVEIDDDTGTVKAFK